MATYTDRLMVLAESGVPKRIGASDTIELSLGNLVIGGDLTVKGDRIVNQSETVLLADNHTYVNAGYTTTVAQTGGLVVNYLPTATATLCTGAGVFTAGVDGTSDPSVTTADSAVFSAGDFIQVSGTVNGQNDGLYEVLSHVGTLLKIRSTLNGAAGASDQVMDFTDGQFVSVTDAAAVITKVNISVLRAGVDGTWESAYGSSTSGFSFLDLASVAGSSLQSAYVSGNTIDANATEGDLAITVDSVDFKVDGSGTAGSVLFGSSTAVASFEADASGAISFGAGASSDFTVTGDLDLYASADLDLDGATVHMDASGQMDLASGAALNVDAVGALSLGAGASSDFTVTGDLDLYASADLDLDGATVHMDASGQMDLASGAALNVDAVGALSLGAGASSDFTVTGDLDLYASADLDLDGATVHMDASGQMDLASGAALNVDAVGALSLGAGASSDFTVTGDLDLYASADLDLDGATVHMDASGQMDLASGAALNVDAVGALSLGAGASSDFTVTGDLDLYASADLDLDGATVHMDASGQMDLASGAALNVDAVGALSLSAGASSDFTVTGDLDLYASANLDLDGASVDIDASGAFSIDGAAASNVSVTGADLTVSTITSGNVVINSAGNLDFDAVGSVNFAAGGNSIEIDPSDDSIDISAQGAFAVGASSAAFVIADNQANAFLVEDAAGVDYIKLDTSDGFEQIVFGNASTNPAFDFAGTGVVSMDALYVSKHAKFEEVAAPSNVADHGFVYVKADGSDSELFFFGDHNGVGREVQITKDGFLNVQAIASSEFTASEALSAGDALYISGASTVGKADATTADGKDYVVGFAQASALSAGEVKMFALPGAVVTTGSIVGFASAGQSVYLSETAGVITVTAPTAAGSTVYKVGYALSATSILFQPQLVAINP